MFKSSQASVKTILLLAGFVAMVVMAPFAFAQFKNPIQVPAGKIPAPPAGGLDPSKLPDIEDIHLGMTPDVVMAKMKTHRGAAKRFKVTGTGKIMRRKAFRSHLLEKKPTKRTRRLGRPAEVTGGDKKRVERLLGRAGSAEV